MLKLSAVIFALLFGASFAQNDLYPVTRIIDGDTVVLNIDGVDESTRLIGINTPETRRAEFYAAEATAFARELLEGKEVRLEYGPERRDKFGRVLAYVYINNKDLSLLLAQAGMAEVYTVAPNDARAPLYKAAVAGAKSTHKGMWSTMSGKRYDRNCSDFSTQDEAQAFFVAAQTTVRDVHRLDSDADGVACAALPRFAP